MTYRRLISGWIAAGWFCLFPLSVMGNGEPQSFEIGQQKEILAKAGLAVVTQSDFDVYMERIEPGDRRAFLSSPARVEEALSQLMFVRKVLVEALENGIFEDSLVQSMAFQAVAVLVAERFRAQFIEERSLESYDDIAYEIYLTESSQLKRSGAVSFKHLLIRVGGDVSELDAMRRVVEVSDRLADGDSLEQLILEFSDDPQVSENNGFYTDVDPELLEQAVNRQIRRMEPGKTSQPFRSSLGWHFLRLEQRQERKLPPYEEVKDKALEMARQRHRQSLSQQFNSRMTGDELDIVDGGIRQLLSRYDVEWSSADRRSLEQQQ